MKEETIYKSQLAKIWYPTQVELVGPMLYYRIIKYNGELFAEEIATKALFPVYCMILSGGRRRFVSPGVHLLADFKYGLYAPIDINTKTLEIELNSDVLPREKIATPEEVARVRGIKGEDAEFIRRCENENRYSIPLEAIKKIINGKTTPITPKEKRRTKSDRNLDSISNLGYDLSTSSNLCDALCREAEYEKLIKNLIIKGESVILVGDPGSGKTALVEKMALDIKNGTNKWLKDKMIFNVITSAIEEDTKYRGDFETKMNKLINFAKRNRDRVILFIDEIHTLYGLGRSNESSNDAMNMLKPVISNRDIIVVGATTEEEYNKYLVPDAAFCGRFEKIEISTLDRSSIVYVLENFIPSLIEKYHVKWPYDTAKTKVILEYIVDLTDKNNQRATGDAIITNPRFAKRVLEDAFVDAVYRDLEKVSINEICKALQDSSRLCTGSDSQIFEQLSRKLQISKEEKTPKIITMEEYKRRLHKS